MTTRRPDAFEEAARRLWVREQKNPWTLNDARFTMLVAKLLRAQHREVRRMVAKKLKVAENIEVVTNDQADEVLGETVAYKAVLAALDRMMQGRGKG